MLNKMPSRKAVDSVKPSTSMRRFPVKSKIPTQHSFNNIQAQFSSSKRPPPAPIPNSVSFRGLPLNGFFAKPNAMREIAEKDCYKLKIVILSNYGDQSFIRCSEIDIFDVNNCKVEVFETTIDDKVSLVPAKNLTNNKYGFDDDVNDWIGK